MPAAVGDFMILDAIRRSGGTAVMVPEGDIEDATGRGSRLEGISLCPEAGACVLAAERLVADGQIGSDERVVIFNTASAIKYQDTQAPGLPRLSAAEPVDYGRL